MENSFFLSIGLGLCQLRLGGMCPSLPHGCLLLSKSSLPHGFLQSLPHFCQALPCGVACCPRLTSLLRKQLHRGFVTT